MKLDGKMIGRIAATLLLLPILYALSSGPLLRYSAQRQTRATTHSAGSPYPILSDKPPADPIRAFYDPLFRSAALIHAGAPLSAYLRIWHVFLIHSGHDNHLTFIVLSGP